MSKLPAVLGGQPAFSEIVAIAQPTLPPLDRLQPALAKMVSSRMITNGTNVRELEARVAKLVGAKHVVAVSSCTSGMMLVWRVWGLQGEVILPSFTFSATGLALIWNNLVPKFVDIDPKSFNLAPSEVERAIGPRTVGIFPVHIYGNPAYPDKLVDIARRHRLKLVFDSAHGLGSTWRGQPLGSFGDAEVFSLSPTKLVVAGEGGLVATNDDDLAHRVRIGRDYGNPGTYDTEFPGLNARMEEFNGLLALQSLDRLEDGATARRRLVDLYQARLSKIPGISFQTLLPGSQAAYIHFSILVDPAAFGLTRDELGKALEAERVMTRRYFFPPLHRQKAFAAFGGPAVDSHLQVTNQVADSVLSLPIFSHMGEEEAGKVCEAIEAIHEHYKEVKTALASRA